MEVGGKRRGHAVVIGGSIAGLLASRVLADHFDRVTVLDRDETDGGLEHRKGVPQSPHAHILLVRGRQIMDKLFPGLEQELIDAGAPCFDQCLDTELYIKSGWAPRVRSDVIIVTCSRNLLEERLRRRAAQIPGVELIARRRVTGLLTDAARREIAGVSVQEGALEPPKELRADLVVDTTGRASRMPRWLEELGFGAPETTVVDPFVSYSTRWFERPAGLKPDWKAIFCMPPARAHGALLLTTEGNRWILSLLGAAREVPAATDEGFLDFARGLVSPVIYDSIKDARPLTDIFCYRGNGNRLVHYDRMRRWPERLVVMGDAVCALNPIHAQGMTVAALSALALARCLQAQGRSDGRLDGLGRHFQKRLARTLVVPWLMATTEDYSWPTTEGPPLGAVHRFSHWYVDHIMHLIPTHPEIFRLLLQVANLTRPGVLMFHPGIVGRVMARQMRRSMGLLPPPA